MIVNHKPCCERYRSNAWFEHHWGLRILNPPSEKGSKCHHIGRQVVSALWGSPYHSVSDLDLTKLWRKRSPLLFSLELAVILQAYLLACALQKLSQLSFFCLMVYDNSLQSSSWPHLALRGSMLLQVLVSRLAVLLQRNRGEIMIHKSPTAYT